MSKVDNKNNQPHKINKEELLMKELEMTDSQIERLVLKLFELYSKEKGITITLKKKGEIA